MPTSTQRTLLHEAPLLPLQRPAPYLLPAKAGVRQQHSLLALWHLLSLDAPCVAAVWTWFIARCCHVTLAWTTPVAMFVAVWMLYAADRLLDARSQRQQPFTDSLEERHRFHARYGRRFLCVLLAAAAVMPSLLRSFHAEELRLFTALGAVLFGYFFVIHWRPAASTQSPGQRRLPKELAVGIFFSGAVFIPTVGEKPLLRSSLFLPAVLLASVCTLNCLYIFAWEHPAAHTEAHWTTRFAARRLQALTCLTLVASIAVMFVGLKYSSRSTVPALWTASALTLTSLFFLLLHAFRRRLDATDLRAAADLALLTPLLLGPFLCFLSR